MADSDGKVKINIETNAEEAVKILDETSQAFNNTGKSAERAKTVFDAFQNEVSENIRTLREWALAGGQNTEKFRKLAKETQETQKQLDLANKAVNDATGGLAKQSDGMASLTSMATKLVGGYIGLQGVIKAFNFTMESVDAYRTQERAISSLNTTLINAGVYTAEYSNHLQQLASDIQAYSNYGDEAILKAVSVGQAFIGQTKITDDLIKSVTDFAAAMDMDLEQAFSLVGKSIGSSTNALGRYGIALKKGMSDSQKMEAITRQLSERYTGQAAQMADATVQLQNSIGDLKEAFGSLFNSVVTNNQKTINKFVSSWITAVNQVRVHLANTQNLNIEDTQTKIRQLYVQEEKLQNKLDLYKRNPHISARIQQDLTKVQSEIEAAKKHVTELSKIDKATAAMSAQRSFKIQDNEPTTSKRAKKIKDAFEQAQEKAQQAEKAFKLALYQSGGNITPQVLQAKKNFEDTKRTVESVQKSFENMTAKGKSNFELLNFNLQKSKENLQNLASADVVDINAVRQAQTEYQNWQAQLNAVNSYFEQPKTKVQQLNSEIQKTTELLQELYLSEGESENFFNAKNKLVELQTEVQNMNTAIASSVGIDWKQVGESIKSNLSSALTTPLQEGETAFDRLGKIGLNVVQMIGNKIIENLLEQISLKQTLNAISGVGNAIGSFFGFGGKALAVAGVMAANGAVFNNGNVVPFANGGVVNKPTVFPMANGGTGLMGEAGAEAVMPLRRMSNGRLGVEAESENGKAVQVNIYNQSGASVETRKRDDGSMDVFIRKVNEALSSERTSSGFRSAYAREDSKGIQAA